MPKSDPVLVASSRVSGIAAGFAHMRNRTAEEAHAQILEILEQVPQEKRQFVLDHAAAGYVVESVDGFWHPAAIDLLVAAGADVASAMQMRVGRPDNNLGGLGQQPGQHKR